MKSLRTLICFYIFIKLQKLNKLTFYKYISVYTYIEKNVHTSEGLVPFSSVQKARGRAEKQYVQEALSVLFSPLIKISLAEASPTMRRKKRETFQLKHFLGTINTEGSAHLHSSEAWSLGSDRWL